MINMDMLSYMYGVGTGVILGLGGYHYLTRQERLTLINLLKSILPKL